MEEINKIENHPVYKQVIKDSFGGVMYNVDNRDKYDATEIIEMWDNLSPVDQEVAGGIMAGAFGFLKGE